MRGFPKHINTKRDIEHLMGFLSSEHATPENLNKGLAFLNGLLASTRRYVFDRTLTADEPLDGPDYVVRYDEDGTRMQFRPENDPNAKLYRMGLTEAEVENWIARIEQAT